MRAMTILLMTLALASCDDGHKAMFSDTGSFLPTPTPTSAVSLQLFPQALPVATLSTVTCPLGQSLTIAFALVIVLPSHLDSSLDSVTVRLIDGSSTGGPAITFPRPGLNNMFGSTFLIGT